MAHGSTSYEVILVSPDGHETSLGFTGRFSGAGLRSIIRLCWERIEAIRENPVKRFDAQNGSTGRQAVYATPDGWQVRFSNRTWHEVTGRRN